MRFYIAMTIAALSTPLSALAQGAGPTQTRDGLGSVGQGNGSATSSANSLPTGSQNANTGAQSRPAYPSGSAAPNPGAAFVRNNPKPQTGSLASPPGNLATSTTHGNGPTTTHPGSGPASGGSVTGK